MKPRTRTLLIRTGIALAVSVGIGLLIHYLVVAGRSTLYIDLGSREIELLAPRWFYLLALLPYIWLVRGESLTDLSLPQQFLSMFIRSSVIAGLALALARPSTIAENDKVATVFLVDVSESVSDKQMAASQAYLDEAWLARKKDDKLFVVT